MNKDFPGNRWLTAFVSFVILFNASACSASSQNTTHASTATASAIATKVPATQTPTPEDTATPTETPTPEVKQFPICQIEKFRDCPITVDDLFNGEYHRWLKTLSKPFDPAKLKWVPMQLINGPGLPVIGYDTNTAPNYRDKSTAPFRRNITSGITTYQGSDYLIIPIEYADPQDPGNPEKNVWVIGVMPIIIKANEQLVVNDWKNKRLHCKNDWTKLVQIGPSSNSGKFNIMKGNRCARTKTCSRKIAVISNLFWFAASMNCPRNRVNT